MVIILLTLINRYDINISLGGNVRIGKNTAKSFIDFFDKESNREQVVESCKHISLVPD